MYGGSLFPQTDVEHLHAHRISLAEFTFRSCTSPHTRQTQVLTESMSRPLGPVKDRQLLHVLVVFDSLTMNTPLPACWLLYCSCVFSIPQPASSTDLAIGVFTSLRLLTSPITIF